MYGKVVLSRQTFRSSRKKVCCEGQVVRREKIIIRSTANDSYAALFSDKFQSSTPINLSAASESAMTVNTVARTWSISWRLPFRPGLQPTSGPTAAEREFRPGWSKSQQTNSPRVISVHWPAKIHLDFFIMWWVTRGSEICGGRNVIRGRSV